MVLEVLRLPLHPKVQAAPFVEWTDARRLMGSSICSAFRGVRHIRFLVYTSQSYYTD